MRKLDLTAKKYLFIENVGNLVCPTGVFLGQHTNLVVSSTTEGSDKPRKYPHIFRDASVIVIAKADLASAVGFDEKGYLSDLRKIAGKAHIIKTAKGSLEGFDELAHTLAHKRDHIFSLEHHH
jgi:hydrogenase nickel incorporation protein HypB